MQKRVPGNARRARILKERWAAGQTGTDAYRARLVEIIQPGMKVLHAGCGWDKNEISRKFAHNCHVIGVDLDDRVSSLFHSEFHLASLDDLPFPQNTFDVIFAEYVFEHLEHPDRVLGELRRVLKPGGTILILTPNLYSYKTLAAKLTPQWFHVAVGRHRYGPGHEADMYPTLYRCNSPEAFDRIARMVGLRVTRLQLITNGPTWFQKIPVVFGMFHFFHLALKRWEALRRLRCVLLVELRSA